MRDRNVDLVLAVVLTAVVAVAAFLPVGGVVVVVLGLAMLVATGYVVGEAVLGPYATSLEGMAMTAVLVLGLPAIGGVVFHAEGVPLHRGAWATLFVVVTAIAAVVAGSRREAASKAGPDTDAGRARRVEEAGDAAPRPPAHADRRRGSSPPVMLGAAGVVAATAIWLAVSGANAQQYPGFTELSLVSHADEAVV